MMRRDRRNPGRHRMRAAFCGLLLALLGAPVAAERPLPTIAIIIDDVGNDAHAAQRLIAVEAPLTLAFLPFLKHTPTLAEQAHRRGSDKEIMLHAPMANLARMPLGPGALEADMDGPTLANTLQRSLAAIPHVRGVNNHMGSLLTQQVAPMRAIMRELARHPLYFVDSRTIASTVAADEATRAGIPNLSRHIFLDNEPTASHVHAQFEQLLQLARRQGHAIAIGHPYDATVSYLEQRLPALDEEGIAVATVSGLWRLTNDNRDMFAHRQARPGALELAQRHPAPPAGQR